MKNISHYVQQAKRKVLIVEDEVINQQILSFILQQEYDVLLANNGQEASTIFYIENPNVIITSVEELTDD